MTEARKQLYKDEADNLRPLDPLEFHALAPLRQHRQAKLPSSASPSSASKPSAVHKRDLRVLMSLRHKASQLSKGTVHTDPVQEAIRNRSARALGAEPKMGAQAGDIEVAELKQTVEVHAEVELRRRATRLGVAHLAGAQSAAPMGVTGFLDTLGLVGGTKADMEQKAKTVFEAMDKDGSGSLDRMEIMEGLEGLGVVLEGEQLEDLLYSAGISEETGKSTMGLSEFVQLVLLANHEGRLFGEGGAGVRRASVEGGGGSPPGGGGGGGSAGGSLRGSAARSGGTEKPPGSWGTEGSSAKGSRPSSRSRSRSGSPGSRSSSRSSARSGSGSTGSSSYQSSGLGPGNLYGAKAFTPPQLPPRERLLSAQGTNVYADDLLQSRLKTLESALKAAIATQGREREAVFSTAIRRGRLSMVTTEYRWKDAKALWTGPVQPTLASTPEGIGIFDYNAYSERMGSMSGERRMYYAGSVVAGQRQGPGVLRWIDETEYAGMWMGGRPMGSGIMTYTDGSWYAGGFKDDYRHGMGGVWYSDGTVFIGQWQLGLQHGVGVVGHVSSVLVDRWGRGREEIPVQVDLMTGQLAKVYRETHERADQMRDDFVRSIFSKRFDKEACSSLTILYIAEFDRGERVGSVHYSQSNTEHSKLATDCLYAVRAGQSMGREAAEYAREAWAKRKAAMTVFRIRERGNEERRKMGIGGMTVGATQVIEEEETENVWQDMQDTMLMEESSAAPVQGLDGLVVEIVAGRMMDGLGEDVAAGICVEVSVDDEPHPLKTAVCWSTKSPEWAGESVYVPVRTDYTVLRCVVLRVEKEDGTDATKDTYLGEVHINASELDPGIVLDKWFDMEFAHQGYERVERAIYVVKTTLWRWFWIIIGDSTHELMSMYLRQWSWVTRKHKATRVRGLTYCLNINPVPSEHRLARDEGVVFHRAIPPKRQNSHHLAVPVFGALHLRIGPVVHPLLAGGGKKGGSQTGSSEKSSPNRSPSGHTPSSSEDAKGMWGDNSPSLVPSPSSSSAGALEADGQRVDAATGTGGTSAPLDRSAAQRPAAGQEGVASAVYQNRSGTDGQDLVGEQEVDGKAKLEKESYDAEIVKAKEQGMGMVRVEFESTHRVSHLLEGASRIWGEVSIADNVARIDDVGLEDFDVEACEPRKLDGREAHRRGVDLNKHCHVPAMLGHNYLTVKLKVGGGGDHGAGSGGIKRLPSHPALEAQSLSSLEVTQRMAVHGSDTEGTISSKVIPLEFEAAGSRTGMEREHIKFDSSTMFHDSVNSQVDDQAASDAGSLDSSRPSTREAGAVSDKTPKTPLTRGGTATTPPPPSGGSQSGGRNTGVTSSSFTPTQRAAGGSSGPKSRPRSQEFGQSPPFKIENRWEQVIGEAQIDFSHMLEGDIQDLWVKLEDNAEVSGELVVDLMEARNLASNGKEAQPTVSRDQILTVLSRAGQGRVTLEWLQEDRFPGGEGAFARLGSGDPRKQRERERDRRISSMDSNELAKLIDSSSTHDYLGKLSTKLSPRRGPRGHSRDSVGRASSQSPQRSSAAYVWGGVGQPLPLDEPADKSDQDSQLQLEGEDDQEGPVSILRKTVSAGLMRAASMRSGEAPVSKTKSVTLLRGSRESSRPGSRENIRSASRPGSRENISSAGPSAPNSPVGAPYSTPHQVPRGSTGGRRPQPPSSPPRSPGGTIQVTPASRGGRRPRPPSNQEARTLEPHSMSPEAASGNSPKTKLRGRWSDSISYFRGESSTDAVEVQRRLGEAGIAQEDGGWCRDQWVSEGSLDFTGSVDPRWDLQRGIFEIRTGHATLTVTLSAEGRDVTQVKGGQKDGFLGTVCLTLKSILSKLRPGARFEAWFPLQQRAREGPMGPDVVSGDVLLGFQMRPRPMHQHGSLKLKLLCEAVQPKPSLAIAPEKRLAKAMEQESAIGTVVVTVFRARGLAPYHLRSPVFLLSLGGNHAKTGAKMNALDPAFDEIFSLDVPLSDQNLHVRLFDALPAPPTPTPSAGGSPFGIIRGSRASTMSPLGGRGSPRRMTGSPTSPHRKTTLTPQKKSSFTPQGIRGLASVVTPLQRLSMAGARPMSPLNDSEGGAKKSRGWKGGVWYKGTEATRVELGEVTPYDLAASGLVKNSTFDEGRKKKRKRPNAAQEAINDLLQNGKEIGQVSVEIGKMAEGECVRGWFPIQSKDEHFIVTVKVFEASGLTPVDLVSSDPYVLVTCADSACQTPVVMQNCDPVWENQVFLFKATSPDTDVFFDVFDYNRFESHIFLGRVVLKVADLPAIADKTRWYSLGPRKGTLGDKVSRRYRSGEPIGSLKLEVSAVEGRTSFGELDLEISYVKEPPVRRALIDDRVVEERSATGTGSLEVCAVAAALKSRGPGTEPPSPSCQVVVADSVSITNAWESTLTPSWDQAFFVPVAPGTQHAIARVLNRGKYSKNDFWGESVIFLEDLPSGDTDRWYRMDGMAPLGRVTVGVLSGSNLVAADSNGLSDPFVEIRLGKQMLKSTAQKRTLDPIWGEDYTFEVWSILDVIYVTVLDWDALGSNDFLGQFAIPVRDLMRRAKAPAASGKATSKAGAPTVTSHTPGAKQAKHHGASSGYELGELDCGIKASFKLRGLNGSGFVDARKTTPVTGTVDLDIRYVADPELRARSSRARLLLNYKERALNVADAAEKEARSIEGADGGDDALGDQRVFDELEQSLRGGIQGQPALSRDALRGTGIFNSRSVVSQLELWRKHGGKTTVLRKDVGADDDAKGARGSFVDTSTRGGGTRGSFGGTKGTRGSFLGTSSSIAGRPFGEAPSGAAPPPERT